MHVAISLEHQWFEVLTTAAQRSVLLGLLLSTSIGSCTWHMGCRRKRVGGARVDDSHIELEVAVATIVVLDGQIEAILMIRLHDWLFDCDLELGQASHRTSKLLQSVVSDVKDIGAVAVEDVLFSQSVRSILAVAHTVASKRLSCSFKARQQFHSHIHAKSQEVLVIGEGHVLLRGMSAQPKGRVWSCLAQKVHLLVFGGKQLLQLRSLDYSLEASQIGLKLWNLERNKVVEEHGHTVQNSLIGCGQDSLWCFVWVVASCTVSIG